MANRSNEESLTDKITDVLRKRILSGQLYPNERLLEEEIAQEMQTSRAPIREAFERLASEGLIRRNGRKGTFVSKFTLQDIEEVYSLRALIECYALTRFIDKANSGDYDFLSDLIDQMEKAAEEKSHSRMANLNLQFHLHIVSSTGHSRIIQLWKDMNQQIKMIMLAVSEGYPSLENITDHHRTILNYITAKNKAEAEAFMNEHILSTGERLVRSLKSRLSNTVIEESPITTPKRERS